MIVVDASAVVELLLNTEIGELVRERVTPDPETLHAPQLMEVEVLQVLRRLNRSGQVSDGRASEAVEDLRDLDLSLYGHEPLLARLWELRENLTAYDACYVALAEALRAPLLTTDARLAAVPGTAVQFQLLA